jgi:hypothetical protein
VSDGQRYIATEMRSVLAEVTEIRSVLAEVYEITPQQLACRLANGTPAFHNYVAHVLRRLTIEGFHIRHGHGEDAWYEITPTGIEAGQAAL